MLIKWLGHSSFYIETEQGTRVVTDPYNSYVGFKMPKVCADIVTVSHAHKDHNATYLVAGQTKVLSKEGAYEIFDLTIKATKSFHDAKSGALRGENLIFSFFADGQCITHMGDIGEDPKKFDFDKIPKTDLLLIPVGGVYTIDSKAAKKYVERIAPRAVAPMHYKVENLTFDLEEPQGIFADGEKVKSLDLTNLDKKVYIFE